jgi:predicted GIY-YIG superfamily endonuclease
MTEPLNLTHLKRTYSQLRMVNLPPIIEDIYPRRMDSWRYLGTAGSCPHGGPGIHYQPFEFEAGSHVALEVRVEWDTEDDLAPTALYRLYDAADSLLYVGITSNPRARFTQHAIYKPWWSEVANTAVSWLMCTRQEALAVEAAAIRNERPIHNGKHNAAIAPFSAEAWPTILAPSREKARSLADAVLAEISGGRWQPGMRVPGRDEMAAASGVGVGTVDRAYNLLKKERALVGRVGHGIFVRQH